MGDRRRRTRRGPDAQVEGQHRRLEFVRELAERVGAEFATLRRARSIAHAWPREHRVSEATYRAHVAYTRGRPRKAEERAALPRQLGEHGKATAPLVRGEIGRTKKAQTILRVSAYLRREQRERLDEIAGFEERSISVVVRDRVDRYVEGHQRLCVAA
jgi:hypothetical protein